MEGGHQQLYCLWTIPPRIAFQTVSKGENFKKALSSLCDDVKSKVSTISHYSSRFGQHMESVANFSRISLLSNRTTAEAHEVGSTSAQRPLNIDEILEEEKTTPTLSTHFSDGMPLKERQITISQKNSKAIVATEVEFIQSIPNNPNNYTEAPSRKPSSEEKVIAECNLPERSPEIAATLIEGKTTGTAREVTDSPYHGVEAISERSSTSQRKVAQSYEIKRRRQRRRRRPRIDRKSTINARSRGHSPNKRKDTQYSKYRHRPNTQSNVIRSRKQRRTSGDGTSRKPRIRKDTKTASGRNPRSMRRKLGGYNGPRYRPTTADSEEEFEYNGSCCIYPLEICRKAFVDFFRDILTG